jgi:hypothetical protein
MKTPTFGVSLAPERLARAEVLKREIATRLRRVCSDWSEADFQALVDDIAATTQKYVDHSAKTSSTDND